MDRTLPDYAFFNKEQAAGRLHHEAISTLTLALTLALALTLTLTLTLTHPNLVATGPCTSFKPYLQGTGAEASA